MTTKKPGAASASSRSASRDKRKSQSSKRWLERQLNDPYVARAKREGFRSRAAFKLIEIDDKHHVLKPGARVVDLGAAPGGWSQVAAKRVGARGRVVAIDLLEMDADRRRRVRADRFPRSRRAGQAARPCSAARPTWCCPTWRPTPPAIARPIISRSWRWSRLRPSSPREVLNAGGAFLAKVIQGGTEAALLATLKRDFAAVKHVKPAASRADSAELYVLATGFRGSR